MKLRDLALVLLVFAVAGFAVFDAVRDDGGGGGGDTVETAAETTSGAPPPARPEETPSVPAEGALVFADARDCRLREIALPTGAERRLELVGTGCSVWGSPAGRRVAFSAPGSTDSVARVELLDLDRADRILEGTGIVGPVVFSPTGARAAWCETSTNGYELTFVTRDVKPLAFCPRGYVGAELARTQDRELLLDGRIAVTTGAHIEQVATGRDGSLALALEGGRIERLPATGRASVKRLPSEAISTSLAFSPDTCAAAAVGPGTVSVVDLGCFRGRGQVVTVSTDNCINRREGPNAVCARYPAPRTFVGSAATWSPDGRWLAVAEPEAIAFHRLVGGYRVIRWPARAADLAWIG